MLHALEASRIMKASKFAESAAQVGVLIGCIVMLNAAGFVFLMGMVLGVGCVVWYVVKGMYLKGSVGRSEARAEARLRAVEASLEQLNAGPDSRENWLKRQSLKSELESLRQELDEYSHSHEH
jgi:hypothetical protein